MFIFIRAVWVFVLLHPLTLLYSSVEVTRILNTVQGFKKTKTMWLPYSSGMSILFIRVKSFSFFFLTGLLSVSTHWLQRWESNFKVFHAFKQLVFLPSILIHLHSYTTRHYSKSSKCCLCPPRRTQTHFHMLHNALTFKASPLVRKPHPPPSTLFPSSSPPPPAADD